MRTMLRRATLAAAASGALLGGLAGWLVASSSHNPPLGHNAALGQDVARKATHLPQCGDSETPMGYVARLSPGHAVGELSPRYPAALLTDPSGAAATNIVLIGPLATTVGGPSVEPALAAEPALSNVGVVYSLATEASLRSCDYQLTDRPSAQAYVGRARGALIASGMVPVSSFSLDPAYFISDDPLDPSSLIVSVFVEGPVVHPSGGPTDVTLHSTEGFAVVLTRGAPNTVVAVGRWPAGNG